jgi:D-aminopeptidase
MMYPGPRNLITDINGLKVGNAADEQLKSGVTVMTADRPFTTSVHVMGGAPGSRETDLLDPDKSVAQVDALVLSGGSAFGLDACSGVAEGLRAMGRGFKVGDVSVPIVPGAILFDLLNGGTKNWGTNPYSELGRAAFEDAAPDFEIGTAGAGTGATTGTLKGGLGSASLVLENGVTVGALVAANPIGSVTTPGNRHFYAAPYEIGSEFGGLGPDAATGLGRDLRETKLSASSDRTNTTIAIVATDAALDKAQCRRVAIAAHDGLARAILPSHTPMDGDLVFCAATGEKALKEPLADLAAIGHAAALCLARAVARAVFEATPADGDLLRCWRELNPL